MKRKIKILLTFIIIGIILGGLFLPNIPEIDTVQAANNVKISKNKAGLYVGETLTLRIVGVSSTITWASSNKKVATVNTKGLVTALKPGTATVTGTVNKNKYSCKVTVSNPTITIDPANALSKNGSEFKGWGTSLAWWGNRIGYSDKMSKEAADLLYDNEKGLGLNIVRYNIGGGDDPTHNHITRTDSEVPGYLYWNEASRKYEYDWSADYNQRNALSKIIKASDDTLIIEAFANSAPYFMTNSGCTSGAEDGKNNLKKDYFDDFANYLAEVTFHFKKDLGITFSSISAMNEPNARWYALSPKQEGCYFERGETQSKMIIELSKAFKAKGLKSVQITASDEQDTNGAYAAFNSLTKDAKTKVDQIDTHTYSGTFASKTKLSALAKENNKELWMSEFDGSGTAGTNSGEMGAALWLSQQIMLDMNGLEPSAWVMWQAIANFYSTDGYNGKSDASSMVDVNKGYWGCAVADIDKEDIVLTQKYYAFGQFTRYIRPGYTLLESTPIRQNYCTMAAYNKISKTLVIVAMNANKEDRNYSIDLSKFKSIGSSVKAVRTSASLQKGEQWKELKSIQTDQKGFTAKVKANSITTYILEGVVIK